MEFKNQMDEYLKKYISDDAVFRNGQFEALESIKDNNKTLIVQKTGWGKSLIYFLGTKYIKENVKNGITVVISPLISLMRDQIRNARAFGLRAEKIIYTNNYKEDYEKTKKLLLEGKVDILFVSPERFANDEFNSEVLPHLNITLFVIDEAHCISNWGHDFRPDYMRLVSIYNKLDSNTPLVLTTATANDRVVLDIEEQFGNKLITLRGELTRPSLELQVNTMPSQAERLAWLKENVVNIEGSGIIYCATVKDTLKVTAYLNSHNIKVEEYHGSIEYGDRIDKEAKLLNNEIKALVSTNALGMGFDKGDLAFVIHFQAPGSLVSYYQEIGRAGRNLDKAKIILLHGIEDEQIQRAFIDGKISETELEMVWKEIYNSSNGLRQNDLLNRLNLGKTMIQSTLKVLMIRDYIFKVGPLYKANSKIFVLDLEKEEQFKKSQLNELKEFKEFINTKDCYMKFIANKLNDNKADVCGKCANCLGYELIKSSVSKESLNDARLFLNNQKQVIRPRAQKPFGINIEGLKAGNLKAEVRNKEGRYLATYGQHGYGLDVLNAHINNTLFSDELVVASANYIKNRWQDALKEIDIITYIPSYEHKGLIKDFSQKLALKLNVEFKELIIKTISSRPDHNSMNNGVKQFENAYTTYHINDQSLKQENILLIDDVINSGMSMFACGLKLKEKGYGDIYPFALSSIT